jgi:hypothetical protein
VTPQQLMAAVRSKDPMRGLCASRQITDEGCDWLKSALDPFHDLQLDSLKGYPDVNTEPTVIVKVRQAAEISKPAGLAAGDNWDCHIALSPIDWAKPNGVLSAGATGVIGYNGAARVLPQGITGASAKPAGYLDDIGGGSAGLAVTSRLDGLIINSVPAGLSNGGDMTFTPGHMPADAGGGYAVQNIVLDNFLEFDDTDLGVYRIVYSGFEVVNTTAQIYKQGACTVYEYGHSFETSQVTGQYDNMPGTPVTTGNNTFATNTFRCPPNTIAEAKIMPGAHTWAAQDGCYCTSKFQGDNPFQGATMRNYVVQQNQNTAGTASGYNQTASLFEMGSFVSPGLIGDTWTTVSGPSLDGTKSGYNAAPAAHFSRMSTAGAYFTGLSPQSTLFVTWRVGLERLPAANKPTFLALASPSASFDPNALLLYNLIANHLPPGCPQGWNDLGKWFQTIAGIAKNVIPGAFPLVSAAQMIMHGLGAVQQARNLPAAIRGVTTVARGAKPAIQIIQDAARRRQNQKGKPALQNFGVPTGPNSNRSNRGRKTQQFSQMS